LVNKGVGTEDGTVTVPLRDAVEEKKGVSERGPCRRFGGG
jgi:hypothetical protein